MRTLNKYGIDIIILICVRLLGRSYVAHLTYGWPGGETAPFGAATVIKSGSRGKKGHSIYR